MPSTRAKIDHYITRSFRDVADDDYVAARALYRVGQDLQFLWAGQQAIEKYFKAILAYNRISTKDLGHNIFRALNRVKSIPRLGFKIPESVERFIGRLGEQGVNRYFEKPINTEGLGILELDEAVHHLRKYCRAVRKNIRTPQTSIDGRLEEVLRNESRGRDDLVWKNLYFGRRMKRKVKFARRIKWANPSNFLFPEIFPELEKLIQFSESVRQHFSRLLGNKNLAADTGSGIKTIGYTVASQDWLNPAVEPRRR
jgi:HEPN domain-containing protein